MKILIFMFELSLASTASDHVPTQEFTYENNLLFTPTVYKELLKANESNFVVSPFLAETVGALVQSGCRGKTAKEIREAISLPDDNEKIQAAIKPLLPTIKANGLYSLQIANKMFVKKGFTINEEFKRMAAEVFQVDSENIDFTKSEEAANAMNSWVEKQTENKTHNLIKSDDLDEDTKLILINTLYFKANLPGSSLKKNTFFGLLNRVTVDTIQFTGVFKYQLNNDLAAKFLELPFEGAEASITFVIQERNINKLEYQLEQVFIPQNLTKSFVEVSIPKFKIESEIDFKPILQNLGVQEAFKDLEADLGGISGNKGDLVISAIKQKAFIDVSEEEVKPDKTAEPLFISNEAGTEPMSLHKFDVYEPFIFFIKVKDVIIFVGKVSSPSY